MKKSSILISLVSAITLLFVGCGEDRTRTANSDILLLGAHGGAGVDGVFIPKIYDTTTGKRMLVNNFVYVPGGFDVDGDGENEDGFWISKYEATRAVGDINLSILSDNNVSGFLAENFKVYNPISKKFSSKLDENSSYLKIPLNEINRFETTKVGFSSMGNTVKNMSALEASVSLKGSQIEGGEEIGLPSNKQWMQLVQLIINNPQNWISEVVGEGDIYQGNQYLGDDRRYFIISNNLLGVDKNVELDYSTQVFDLSGNLSEWTDGLIAKGDRFVNGGSGVLEFESINNMPTWLKPFVKDLNLSVGSEVGAGQYHDGFAIAGANDTLEISTHTFGDVDDYASVARGGSSSIDDKSLVGIGAMKLTYGPGYKGPTVGFRGASKYIK